MHNNEKSDNVTKQHFITSGQVKYISVMLRKNTYLNLSPTFMLWYAGITHSNNMLHSDHNFFLTGTGSMYMYFDLVSQIRVCTCMFSYREYLLGLSGIRTSATRECVGIYMMSVNRIFS